MNPNYTELARNLRNALASSGVNYETEGGDKDAITAVYLGRAISVALQLPTSPVPNPGSFFISNYYTAVQQTISVVNEGLVINTELVFETVQALWGLRYDLVYSPHTFLSYMDVVVSAHPHVIPERISKALNWLLRETQDNDAYAFRNTDRIIGALLNPAQAVLNGA